MPEITKKDDLALEIWAFLAARETFKDYPHGHIIHQAMHEWWLGLVKDVTKPK